MLYWIPDAVQPKLHRSASSSSTLIKNEAPLTDEEMSAFEALKATWRKDRSLKNPQMKDHVRRLMSGQGKCQETGLLSKTRVRKDFRQTNLTTDIPGATATSMIGRTSSGLTVDPNRLSWPYAKALAHDAEEQLLFEMPSVGHKPNGNGRSTFEQQVYRTSTVETHLTIPGVGLKCVRRDLEPIIVPPPPEVDQTYPRTLPANSLHHRPELRDFEPSQATMSPWRSSHAAMGPVSRVGVVNPVEKPSRPMPKWAKPSLDPPAQTRTLDRSLSTDDIAGARPRRLVSINARHVGFR